MDIEETLENHDKQNLEIPTKKKRIIITLNKCNQCNYTSACVSTLKRRLKTHSVEKSNKCNQCDYATAYVSALRTHKKKHSGEKQKQLQPM